MNIGSKVWRGLQSDAKAMRMIFGTSYSSSWSYLLNSRTRYDYAGAVGDGTNNSAVVNCLEWIRGAFPQAPLIVETRKGTEWETVPDHPLLDLMNRPNPFFPRSTLWSCILTAYHANGNAYLLKDRAAGGAPAAIWYESPDNMEPISERDTDFITYYRRTVGGRQEEWKPEDVIHIRNGIDPHNSRLGYAPLRAALREVFADDEAALMIGALMRNQGIPGLVVSPRSESGIISKTEAETIKADMESRTGGDNRGRALVLGGSVNVDKIAFSPEEMNLRELRRTPEERIAGALRLPAIIAQLGAGLDRSTYANFAEARESAWMDNIIPTQTVIAEFLTLQLLPDFADPSRFRVGFDASKIGVLQDDENEKTVRVLAQLQAGAITVAEARRDLGKDAGPEHEFYTIPLGYKVQAQLEAPEPEPKPAEGPEPIPPQLEAPTDDEITALLSRGEG